MAASWGTDIRLILLPILFVALMVAPQPVLAQAPTFIMQWGTAGSAPGQFLYPTGAAVGLNGDVYISDQYNYRVQQFTSSGQFVRAWGAQGTASGRFGLLSGVGTDQL